MLPADIDAGQILDDLTPGQERLKNLVAEAFLQFWLLIF